MGKRNGMKEETESAKAKLSWQGLKRLLSLLRFMWPKKWAFFGGLAALALSSLGGTLAFPMLLGDLLDAANPEASLQRINQLALILLAIFCCKCGAFLLQDLFVCYRYTVYAGTFATNYL